MRSINSPWSQRVARVPAVGRVDDRERIIMLREMEARAEAQECVFTAWAIQEAILTGQPFQRPKWPARMKT